MSYRTPHVNGTLPVIFMRYLYIILFISISILNAQENLSHKEIIDDYWNNNIVITDKEGNELSETEQLSSLFSAGVITNCWSNFYRYLDLVQQPTSSEIFHVVYDSVEVRNITNEIFEVLSLYDNITGEDEKRSIFYFKYSTPMTLFEESLNINIFNKENEYWYIEKLELNNGDKQLLDSCHNLLELVIHSDYNAKLSYNNESKCEQRLSASDRKKVLLIGGYARFYVANHRLSGKFASIKTKGDNIYFKFENGRIRGYKYKLKKNRLILSYGPTIIIFKRKYDR